MFMVCRYGTVADAILKEKGLGNDDYKDVVHADGSDENYNIGDDGCT